MDPCSAKELNKKHLHVCHEMSHENQGWDVLNCSNLPCKSLPIYLLSVSNFNLQFQFIFIYLCLTIYLEDMNSVN